MNTGKTLFAQLMDFLPWSTFDRIVSRDNGNRAVPTLPCAAQYQVMAFAQITHGESLRDIERGLSAQSAYGISENAVRIQIWLAVSVYVLAAIVRKRLRAAAAWSNWLPWGAKPCSKRKSRALSGSAPNANACSHNSARATCWS